MNSFVSVERQIGAQLDRIAKGFLEARASAGVGLPVAPDDPEWSSLCTLGQAENNQIFWKPVLRTGGVDFSGLERALEHAFPPELTAFYGHFWSGSIPVCWGERTFELLQLWNPEDEENLRHNFLGHAMEKKRIRQDLTLFFAVVDDARFLSIDVGSGEVLLEELGQKHPETIAPDLGSLLQKLEGISHPEQS